MKAYLRASQQHNDGNKHKKKAKRKSDRRDGDTTTYLDGESTASDDDDDDIVDKLPFKSVKSGIIGQSAAMASPGRLGLAAAETLAQLLLDEIQSNKGTISCYYNTIVIITILLKVLLKAVSTITI